MNERYYFTSEGLVALENRARDLLRAAKEVGEDIGLSTHQTSETWHDNFGYEEGQRQYFRIAHDLEQIAKIRENAVIATDADNPYFLGRVYRIRAGAREKDVVIGSWMIPEGASSAASPSSVVSYVSPLASVLLRKKAGDSFEFPESSGRVIEILAVS